MKLKRNKPIPPAKDLTDAIQQTAHILANHISGGFLTGTAAGLAPERRQQCIRSIDALVTQLGVAKRIMLDTTPADEVAGYITDEDIRNILRPGA
jgi:hypothetical protein